MKTTSAVVLALAAAANAVKFTNPSVKPEPGKPFELTWDDAEGPVTITLKSGESGNLKTVEEIATDVTGGSTKVTLDPSKLPSDTYAFEIVDKNDPSNPNYSVQFAFKGDASPSASASASASKTGSSSSASATESQSSTASSSSASRTPSSTASGVSSSRPSKTSSAEEEDDEDVPDSGSARNMSPIAFIFVTAAAMLYFN